MSREEALMREIEELTKKIKEVEERAEVLEEEEEEIAIGWEESRGSQEARGSQEERERSEDVMRAGNEGLAGKAMGSAIYVELQAQMVAEEVEQKKPRRSTETAGITAAGIAGRAERLNIQGVNREEGGNLYFPVSTVDGINSCAHFSFNSGHRRDGNNFPGVGVGQQQLWARGVIGQQQQQQHNSWNRHQPQFDVHKQRFRPLLRQQHYQHNLRHQQQRSDGSNFPGGGVGQQQLRDRAVIGQQQQQQHDRWNRHQPQFGRSGTCWGNGDRQWSLPRCVGEGGGRCACVCSCSGVNAKQRFRSPLRQHYQHNLRRHQQRSSYRRLQHFRPPSQHPHQRGGPKSGPGGPWDCGHNAAYYLEESPVPANTPMGSIPKCSRCGRYGHLASICGTPRRFEGNCVACGKYGHLRRCCATARRPIPMQSHASVVTASGDGSGEATAIWRAVPRKTKVRSGRPLQRIFIDSTGPYPPSRAPFVGEVPTWGGGAVVDAAAAVVAPAAATVTGSGVFPALSVRGAEGAPASAAVAASTVTCNGVLPAASARGAKDPPASAAVAAVTATAVAVAAAAIPPDGARETAAARGGVFPTPPVDWTTARHHQPSETATTQRRRYQGTQAVTRSGLRRTVMSGALTLLEADEQTVRSLATGPEADGDFELPADLPCNLDARNVRTHLGGGGAQGVCRTYSGRDVQLAGVLLS